MTVLILIGAAALSAVLGKFLEAGAIGTIVVLFALLGFLQEYRAERAIAALRRMAVPTVRVTRDGVLVDVPAVDLVPGDIVNLEAGNVVPADLRLVEVAGLRVAESALTGESEPVDKQVEALTDAEAGLGDRVNMAYSGTQVTYGRGVGVVVASGMQTDLGRIATMLQSVDASATPLQERLDRVGKQLALGGVGVAGAVVALGAVAGESPGDLALTAVSVAVAVIPEGLPAVVTFTLAIGAQRMLRRNALIRKLPAVETLGSVTVICSDKTGTLTQNRMTVTVVHAAGESTAIVGSSGAVPLPVRLLLGAAALCNDGEVRVEPDGSTVMIVDPTETALLVAALEAGLDLDAVRSGVPRLGERPFDSDRKRMSTIHGPVDPDLLPAEAAGLGARPVAFVKGAMDGLLERTVAVMTAAGTVPLDDEQRARLLGVNDELARRGMRVLGVAARPLVGVVDADGSVPDDVDIEDELTVLGLVGIIDPPRTEARDAIARCTSAGIRTVMITGDHPLTATAIAEDLGIPTDGGTVPGAELEHVDDERLEALVRTTNVFARVAPGHKLRIVGALQASGEVASMTGDGVNDAPALRRADIGVAMGITGTDVSKEASDIVLRDDNFATIVAAVEEGRVIYDNLRRFVKFAVAGNIGKIAVMLLWPIPFLVAGVDTTDAAVALLPLQLLWLNLMTDGLLGLSLGVEPAERGVMARPPHTPGGSIWAGGLGRTTIGTGVVIGAGALAIGWGAHALGSEHWQTMLFTGLAMLQFFQAIGTRSTTASLRTIGWRTNPTLLGIAAIVAILQVAAVTTPLADFLGLTRIGVVEFGICVAAGVALLVGLEAHKALLRRRA
ncbi:MAG: cation-translocating P-type ATPase [Actinobacteria bacterium]|nr:cation-translocating P-type ATPase [Actinomycetota bacterium]